MNKYKSIIARIEELEKNIDQLRETLGTFIGWSALELGRVNTIKLLDMLPPKIEEEDAENHP